MTTEQLELNNVRPTSGINENVLPWVMYTVAALFYCYVYFLRVSPSMMMREIEQHFHITAAQFGQLSAFYFYAYTPLQLPVGIIIDRFGTRVVLALASLMCALGIAIFITAEQFALGCLGRFLIGFGSAFGYLSILKIAGNWLPPNRFATAAGLTTAFGMIAAIFSDNFLADIVKRVGFQEALYSGLIAGFLLSMLIFSIIRNQPKHKAIEAKHTKKMTVAYLVKSAVMIFKSPQTWIIGIVGTLLYLPALVFLDVWGVEYLKVAYHLNSAEAAHAISLVFVGWIIGGPSYGAISDRIKRRRLPLLVASIVAAIVMTSIFYVPLSHSMLCFMMFILGITCGSHPLVFSLTRENFRKEVSGTSTAVCNVLVMAGGMINILVGFLLDHHWSSGIVENGHRIYSLSDYNYALAIIPIGLVLSSILTMFIKETYCKLPE